MNAALAIDKSIRAEIENITPEMAREYLKLNKTTNRKLSQSVVRSYRTDMLENNFKMTGEPIQFDVNGVLVNGQHRMQALAGIENESFVVSMLVVRNVPEEAFRYMDNGARRTTAQVAQMENISNATTVASVARILYLIETFGPGYLHGGGYAGKVATRSQILDYVRDHFELIQRAAVVAESCRDLMMASVTGACYCLFYRKSGPSAEEFFERLRTGINLKEHDAIYQFRQKLIANRSRRGKMAQVELMALCILAWKAFLNGRPVRRLQWKYGSEFPTF